MGGLDFNLVLVLFPGQGLPIRRSGADQCRVLGCDVFPVGCCAVTGGGSQMKSNAIRSVIL